MTENYTKEVENFIEIFIENSKDYFNKSIIIDF